MVHLVMMMTIKNRPSTALLMGYPYFIIAACFCLIAIHVESAGWLVFALVMLVMGVGRGALWWRNLSQSELVVSRSSVALLRAGAPCVELEVREGDVVAIFPMSRWAPWQRFPSGTQLLVLPAGVTLTEPVDTRGLIEIYRAGSIVCRVLREAGFDVRELRPG